MTTDSPFPGSDATDGSVDASTSEPVEEPFADGDGVLYDDEVTPEYGILGLTLRELLIVGVWLVAFVLSFFPVIGDRSLWAVGIEWILPIGVPTVAVFLLVLRRFSPDGIRRVGSLGIDQFASVAFSVSACVWLSTLWLAVAGVIDTGHWGLGWNGVVMLIASLALVALSVFAPIIPGLKEDFQGRLVTLAHRNANPVRPVIARPRPVQDSPERTDAAAEPVDHDDRAGTPAYFEPEYSEPAPFESAQSLPEHQPAQAAPTQGSPTNPDVEFSGQYATDEVARFDVAEQVPLSAHASGGGTGTAQTTSDEDYVPSYSRRSRNEEIVSDTGSIEALITPEPETGVTEVMPEYPQDAAPQAQPFWILAPTERDVYDERGEPVFRIGPNAWALVIEDRGGAYVVRHDDGRIGYLHDIADISRG